MSFCLTVACVLAAPAGAAWASGGGGAGSGDLHVNWWAWDAHAPPVGWFILDFILFVFLLVHFTKRPVKQAFARRHTEVKQAIGEATAALEKARTKHADYRGRLSGIECEVSDLLEGAKKSGEQERDGIVDAAKAYAERLRKDNASVMEQEEARARERLRRLAARDAFALAEKMLREQLTDQDRERLIEESILELEADTRRYSTSPSAVDAEERGSQAVGGAA